MPIRTTIRNKKLVIARREHIARCAATIMTKKGFDKVSMQEIVDACDITIGSLYRYIGTKDDIIYLIMGHTAHPEKFCEDIAVHLGSNTATETLELAIDRYCRLVDKLQDEILFGYQETKNMSLDFKRLMFEQDANIVATFERILKRGREIGEFQVDDIFMVANDIVVAAHMWAVRRWRLKKYYSLDQYIKRRIDIALKCAGAMSIAR